MSVIESFSNSVMYVLAFRRTVVLTQVKFVFSEKATKFDEISI